MLHKAMAGKGISMKALRTLVVEDDAIISELLAETLESLGHTVSRRRAQ